MPVLKEQKEKRPDIEAEKKDSISTFKDGTSKEKAERECSSTESDDLLGPIIPVTMIAKNGRNSSNPQKENVTDKPQKMQTAVLAKGSKIPPTNSPSSPRLRDSDYEEEGKRNDALEKVEPPSTSEREKSTFSRRTALRGETKTPSKQMSVKYFRNPLPRVFASQTDH